MLRPDGVEVSRQVVDDAGAGSHPLDIALPANAYTGRWTVEALADPKGDPIGQATFQVDDFVPPRIEFTMSADPQRFAPDLGATRAVIDADYLYGGAAAGIEGELTVSYAAARDPFGRDDGFQFGLAEDEIDTASPEPVKFLTDEAGHAEVPVNLSGAPSTTSPIELGLHAQLFDVGGRAVGRDATAILLPTAVLIGVRPTFDEYVRWGEKAGFQVEVLDRAGKQVPLAGLQWDLVRESYGWRWWADGNDRWYYRGFLSDEPVAHGTLDAPADAMATIGQDIDWGWYRLEVYDPASGAATSVRFRTGWSHGQVATDAPPDRVTVSLSSASFAPGDTATVFIDPPFDAEVALAVMNNGVRDLRFVHVPDEGTEVSLQVPDGWAPGAYVVATAYGAPDPLVPSIPQRAVGVAWLAVERPGAHLDVAIDAPDETLPERQLDVGVDVSGLADGDTAYVTLAAVDDGILQLTHYAAPDAAGYFLGQRRLGVELRDLYGKLIDATGATPGDIRTGGDRMQAGGMSDALSKRSSKVVALFSGIVPVVDGVARVPLDIPDFNGRLRLMAVAWSARGVGNAEATMTVAAPVIADLVLPRFLAPDDRSTASLAIDNLSGPAGSYSFALTADGPVTVEQPATVVAELGQGDRIQAGFRLTALDIGTAHVSLTVTGPDGAVSQRSWDLPVRAATPLSTERRVYAVPPGTSYLVPASLTAGYQDGGLDMTLVADASPPIDTATLLRWLYLYPYGCAEQTTSTAMPLLYADRLDATADVLDISAEELSRRVDGGIRRLTAMQRSDGDFGYWGWWNSGSTWLTAYVMDFLTRARAAGHWIPESVTTRAFAALQRGLDSNNGSVWGKAYALHILARNGQGDAYDLAYAADRLSRENLGTIDRALLGATFAELGDPVRARAMFDAAREPSADSSDAGTFGSPLRDLAMATALLVESGLASPAEIATSVSRLSDRYAAASGWWTSTQEKAWLVRRGQCDAERRAGLRRRRRRAPRRRGPARHAARLAARGGRDPGAQPRRRPALPFGVVERLSARRRRARQQRLRHRAQGLRHGGAGARRHQPRPARAGRGGAHGGADRHPQPSGDRGRPVAGRPGAGEQSAGRHDRGGPARLARRSDPT